MRRLPIATVIVFAFIATVHVASFLDPPMPPIHGDGYYTYLWARSLAFDGDLDLTNDYEICGDPWRMPSRRTDAQPGQWPHNTWSPGPALIWAPLLLVARVTFEEPASSDRQIAQGCRGPMPNFAMFGTVLLGLLTVWLVFLMARRHVGVGPALLAALGVAIASPLPYYSTLLPSYGHAAAAFGAALALERWDATRGSRSPWRWALVGGLVGLAVLMRTQNALVALAPLAEWLLLARGDLRDRRYRRLAVLVGAGLLFTACVVVVFFPQMYIWKNTYGTWLAVPQGPHYMRWEHPCLDGVFFGSTGGLLVWNPLMYLGVIGLIVGLRDRATRFPIFAVLIVFAAYTWVNASVWDWWGSMGFSNRRFTEMALPLGIGIAVSCERLFRWAQRRPRRFAGAALGLVVLVAGGWNYGGMWVVAEGKIRSWHEDRMDHNWRVTFIELTKDVHEAVGNPFAWPAALPWAVAHDTHPRRYDVMRGMGVFYEEFQDRRARTRAGDDVAEFGRGIQFDYAVEGFEEDIRRVEGRAAAVTTGRHARMLVPFFADDVEAIEMKWCAVREPPGRDRTREAPARATLRWNGRPLAQLDVAPRWTTTRIELPRGTVQVGVNELEWTIVRGPVGFESMRAIQAPLPEP